MHITFLGTRGNIKIRSRIHYRHTATLISFRKTRILIDWGADWYKKISTINPDAIFITHAHPDHAQGLEAGAPCPVYATLQTWDLIKSYPIADQRIITPDTVVEIGGIAVQPFSVVHSLNAPAVGYRITAGKRRIFYVPDLVKIKEQKQALSHIDMYIGDGAIITRSLLVRKRGRTSIGHAPISTQLDWCQQENVPRALFTHCGTEIVSQEPQKVADEIAQLGKERGVRAQVAFDGMKIRI